MYIFLTGGKTMGHITPLLSIYKRLYKEYEIVYFGLSNSMEEKECERLGITFFKLKCLPFYRKNLFKNFKTIYYIIKDIKTIKEKYKNCSIKAIFSSGGFVSIPLTLSFRNNKKIKKILIEPNIVIGLANKFLLRYVNYICVAFPTFKGKKFRLTGNPIEIEVSKFDHPSFYVKKEMILFLGGSNGALEIVKLAYDFNQKNPSIPIFVITGERYYDTYVFNENAYVFKKISSISSIFEKFKIIVSRSGASTITEIIKTNSCAIFLPSKNVSANHQYKNAKYLVDRGCAIMIDDYTETSYQEVTTVYQNDVLITKIKNTISELNFKNSVEEVIKLM